MSIASTLDRQLAARAPHVVTIAATAFLAGYLIILDLLALSFDPWWESFGHDLPAPTRLLRWLTELGPMVATNLLVLGACAWWLHRHAGRRSQFNVFVLLLAALTCAAFFVFAGAFAPMDQCDGVLG